MKLIRGLHNFKQALAKLAVTLGNFDGLHLGHQALLTRLKTVAAQKNLPTLVVLFEPQPREFFEKIPKVARLMRWREKFEALNAAGIDYCLTLKFNDALANLSADDFVRKILIEKCQAQFVLIGDDFRYGAKRLGDVNSLRDYAFEVEQLAPVLKQNIRISSTQIREALQEGAIEKANSLLGHPYTLVGKVAHGEKRGRELGFPTANIFLHRKLVPLRGIFAVKIQGADKKILQGSAYVGTRPVFNGVRVIMEVHILDFSGDLYGKNLQVEFLHKIRDDQHFVTIQELVLQITGDIAATRAYFKQTG